MAQDLPQVEPKRQMDFGFRGSATHDSNVSRSTKAGAALRGLTQADTTYTVAGTVSVVQPLGKQALFLNGSAGYDYHDKNRKLDGRRIDLGGGGVKLFGRGCRGLVFGRYGANQSQLDDISFTVVKNVQTRTNVSAALECQPATGFGFVLSAGHDDTSNTATTQKTQDSNTDNATVVLAYVRPSLGTFRLIANFAETDFPNRDPLLGASLGDHLSVASYGVGYQRKFGTRIEVSAAAQRTLIKRDAAPVGVPLKSTATTYDGEIKYRAGTRLDFSVGANRSVTPSNRIGQLFDINTDVDVSARYRLGTRIELETGYRWEKMRSQGDGTTLLGPILTNSDKDVIYGSIRYRRAGGAALGLEVRQEDRETNLPTFDYTNTAIALTLDVPF
ncbi:MAG: hypothetical protein KKE02_17305 [Alphaproteobacteria bacterium]|nr:hypothetical protein [Alphaproteobacteria bacterium]MBU1512950.1 hypothetical protein [Alphaproteobacteria bacterium]MBU2094876.1 hypothetical protein [Alphaproteobacteria bacterium]MBU2152782.1 hypothetical protein [Alphaproteobacteria bacterium]MBU2306309.1 hypothetical protein [Alphaproteobacteria bacterium]